MKKKKFVNLKGREMDKYWKIDILKKLIKIEEENDPKVTITMNYMDYLKRKLKLMEEIWDLGVKRND